MFIFWKRIIYIIINFTSDLMFQKLLMFLSNTTLQIKSCTSDINFSTQKSMRGAKSEYRGAVHSMCNLRHKILSCSFSQWARLNYTTTHHHPPPPTTIHQRPSPPTTSQNIFTTTHHHPKNGPQPSKSQNIFIYNLLLTASFSLKYNIPLSYRDFVW